MRSVSPILPVIALVASAFPVPAQKPASGEMVKLTFPNADVRDVLEQYASMVGKRLIYDNQVQGTVNINVPEVPREEAIKIIEITLIMNGYHVVPVDSDPNLLKVTGLSRTPRSVGVPIITDPEPIPDNEQVIMYLVRLQYADPAEMAQILTQAMPPSRTEYAPNIVPLPKAQALLITENTTIIRALQRIIRATDVEPTKVEGEFITLQRASAKDVVQMLEKMFEKTDKPTTGGGAVRPATAPAVPGAAPGAAAPSTTSIEIGGGMNEDSMLAGKVRLTADERTNRIYVVSRPANLPLIRKIIQGFDEDVHFNEPVVHLLKFVSSGDILDALVKAIADPGSKDAASGSGATNGQRAPGSTTPAINNNTNNSNSLFGNQGGRSGSSSSLASNMSLQTEARNITPNTVIVGNARIMADNRRNAIIVIGSEDVKEKVSSLIRQLDVRAPQVMLSTVIGELTLSDSEQFGINYLLGRPKGLRPTSTTGTTTTGTDVQSQVSPFALSASGTPSLSVKDILADSRFTKALVGGATGFSGFISAGNLDALVTALEQTQKFRVTSRPSLFASNNKKATITSGEEIAVATSIQSGVTGATTTGTGLVSNSSVQFKSIELRLEVVPLINSDKEVYLDILQKVEEQTGETKVDTNTYPKISTRALNTSVMVPNEGTLVLGGLIKQNRSKTVTGIPILSRTPLIGPLFRSTSVDNKRTELVILIRPSVSTGPEEDFGVRDRHMEPMRIPVNLEDGLFGQKKESIMDPIRFRSDGPAVKPQVVKGEAEKTTKAEAVKPPKSDSSKPKPPQNEPAKPEPLDKPETRVNPSVLPRR
ncbi:MAG: secretin N-terminal domain-containing protein [Verrucomicrobiota bacterium]